MYNLFREAEGARAAFRSCAARRASSYVLTHKISPLFKRREPAYDVFIGLGKGFRERLEELVGELGENLLRVRMMGELHVVYSGPLEVAEVTFPDEGVPRGTRLRSGAVDVDLGELIRSNEEVVRVREAMPLHFLRRWGEGSDEVIVPLSGCRDSAAALALARKASGAVKLTAVYVGTGVDFPQNGEYVERITGRLGVRLEVEYADVRGLRRGASPHMARAGGVQH